MEMNITLASLLTTRYFQHGIDRSFLALFSPQDLKIVKAISHYHLAPLQIHSILFLHFSWIDLLSTVEYRIDLQPHSNLMTHIWFFIQ